MVNSVDGGFSQVAYIKALQTSGNTRQFGLEGSSTAGVEQSLKQAKTNAPQFSRSAESATSRFAGSRDNDADDTGLDRLASTETQNAEAVRGSLLDISV